MFYTTTLRSRLGAVAVLAVLPSFGFTLFEASRAHRQQAEKIHQDASRLAHITAAEKGRILDEARHLLSLLGAIPALYEGSPKQCHQTMARLAHGRPGFTNFLIADLDGHVVCSAVVPPHPVNIADRPYFRRAVSHRAFTVDSLAHGRITNGRTLTVALPLPDEQGAPRRVAAASIDLAWFQRAILDTRRNLLPHSRFTTLNKAGIVLSSYPDSDSWIGTLPPPPFPVQAILSGHEGLVEAVGPDGARRLYAFASLRTHFESEPLRVVVDAPAPSALGLAHVVGMPSTAWWPLAAALALGFAWVGGHALVVRRIRTLARRAQQLAPAGAAPDARRPAATDELSDMASTLDRIALTLDDARRLRREAESALHRSEGRLCAQFDHALDGILLIDDPGKFVDANPAACTLLGYTREELLQQTLADVTPGDWRSEGLALWTDFLQKGQKEGEYKLRRKDGERVPVECRAVANILPGLHLSVVRDITARKRAEKQLKTEQALLKTIVDRIPVMISLIDRGGRVTWANNEWQRVLGWSLEEAREHDVLAQEYPDAADRRQALNFILQPPAGWQGFRTRTKQGGVLDTTWTNVILPDGSSLGIGRDVTEHTREEKRLRIHAAQLEALSRRLLLVQETERRSIAKELHDEMGQMLTGLKLALEAAVHACPDGASQHLGDATTIATELIDRVRKLAVALRPAILDDLGLFPAARSLVLRLGSSTGLQLTFDHTGIANRRFSPEIETAAYRIAQEALTNVMRHAAVKEACLTMQADDRALTIDVTDHGCGFDWRATWDAGESTGLSGMHERARLLGGMFTIESSPGTGTHIRAELPLELPKPGRTGDDLNSAG